MAETKAISRVERCILIDEHCSQDFVTALSDPVGMQKELLTGVPIHRRPPGKVSFHRTLKTPLV